MKTVAMAAVGTKPKKLYLSRPPPKVYLQTINPHITCGICDGYLIDATTVDECLHSFCRSCLVQHIRSGTHCPVENCETVINKVKPNIKLDTTLQAIVYKLVPGLYDKEILCRRAFYRLRKEDAQLATPEQRGDDTEHLIFDPNEEISLTLEYSENDSHSYRSSDDEHSDSSSSEAKSNQQNNGDDEIDGQLRVPKYLKCPAIFRISNLKKFLMSKFGINPNKFCVEIMYKVKSIALPDYYTLMDVAYIYTWKRDAPMKFFYCVRAVTKENVAMPNVASLLRPSAEYLNAKNAFLDSLRMRDTDQDQSSDADSDMRSESGVSSTAPAPATSAAMADTSTTKAVNGNASSTQESTISEATTTTTSTTKTAASTTTQAHSSTTNVATTQRTTVSQQSSATSKKENETNLDISRTQANHSPSQQKSVETKINRSPTNRTSPVKTNNNSAKKPAPVPSQNCSPRKTSDAPTNPNGNDKTLDSPTKSPSPSRSNFREETRKEKVKDEVVSSKTNPITNVKSPTRTESSVSLSLKSSPKSTSPRPTLHPKNESAESPAKSKTISLKESDHKSNAEDEYDFDQHLLEEKLTEKNKFLKSIHLAPRTAAEMLESKSPSKNEPKPDQPTDSSKDVKSPTPAVNTNASSVPTPISTPTAPKGRTSSPQTTLPSPIDVDKDHIRHLEQKASKRKSREPIKNVPSFKRPDSNWPHDASTSKNNGERRLSPSLLPAMNHLKTDRGRQLFDAMILDVSLQNKLKLNQLNQSIKCHEQQQQQPHRQPTFKVPSSTESVSSSGGGGAVGKTRNKATESETSIIINNVQRPNQADTPRPPMNYSPNMNSYFPQPKHQLYRETEIKELRTDDAMNVKVYGPAMTSDSQLNAMRDELLKNQHLKKTIAPKRSHSMSNQNESSMLNSPAFSPHRHAQSTPEKRLKLKSGGSSSSSASSSSTTNSPIDMKKKLNSTGELEVITSTSTGSNKRSAAPKRQSGPSSDSVHTLLQTCNITLPSSLSVTLTNDEIESNRSFFNQKKTPVNNSIEIVKLPDDSSSPSPSPSPSADQIRYTKAKSNSPNLSSRSDSNHSGSSSPPVAINLINNKPTTSAPRQSSSNSPVAGNPSDYQSIFTNFTQKIPSLLNKPKPKTIKPNLMPAPSPSYQRLLDHSSPQKQKLLLNGPKAAAMQLAHRMSPQKLADPSKFLNHKSLSTQFSKNRQISANRNAGSGSSGDSGSSSMSGSSRTNYLSIPTSSKPMWTDYATTDLKSAHLVVEDNFHKY